MWRSILVVLVILVAFILEENIRGRISLARYKTEFRVKGEKLTLEELNLPKPPKEGNGADSLLKAASELIAHKQEWPLARLGVSARKMVGPGEALVLFRRERMIDPTKPWTTNAPPELEWADLEKEMAEAGPILQRARTALRQTVIFEVSHEVLQLRTPPHYEPLRNLARWFYSSAVLNLHQGKLDAAIDDLEALNSLGRCFRGDSLIISELVRYAVDGIGFETAWAILQAPDLNETQLQRLDGLLNSDGILLDLVRAAETERATIQLTFDASRRSVYGPHLFEPPDLRDYVEYWMWRAAWFEQDKLNSLRTTQAVINCARVAAQARSFTEGRSQARLKDRGLKPWFAGRNRLPFLSSFFGSEDQIGMVSKAAQVETQREMNRAVVALKRYQLKHGTLPSDLAAVIPELLPEPPTDYMDGKPLRYKLNGKDSFVLYSVGKDCVDDGGDASQPGENTSFWMWWGRDAVWPQAASER